MKTLKTILALGIVAALFAGCSKNANSTNGTTTTTTNTTNTTSKATQPTMPTTTTAPPVSSTPAGSTAETSSSSGAGETFTHPDAGVQFTLPAGWTSKADGEKIIATSEHEAVSVVLWVPRGDDFDKATDELMQQLDNVIKNPQITSPGKESTHNGMRAYTAGGNGEVNGRPILWEVDILQAKKPFFVVTFASPDMFRMHQADYQQLLASLKPVR
ncbi:MAG TPA: hypothetical protein VJT74_12275 [Pyrinomonadaceae bacterium]|nr:hypothetical protein [Pyrinomonadaceae bacterium]